MLLADVDGDGMLELVTGHADRTVYVHKLETASQEKTSVQNHLIIGIHGLHYLLCSYLLSHSY